MMWIRNVQVIPPSYIMKRYLFPIEIIHCELCGNFPMNGVISLNRDVGCCSLQPVRSSTQKRLAVDFDTSIESSSKPTVWLARSTGQTKTSVPERDATAFESDVANTVQTDLGGFIGQ